MRRHFKHYLLTLTLTLSAPLLAQVNQAQNTAPDVGLKADIPTVAPEKVIAAQNLTYQGNQSVLQENFTAAEAAYRKAHGTNPNSATPSYNLGSTFYKNKAYLEALTPLKKAAKAATTKEEKHTVFHNMGNVFMKNKSYEKAVTAYKEALRNNPTDNQTRYNLALAKEMLKKEQQEKEQNKDQQDQKDSEQEKDKENKENKDKEGEKDKDKKGNPEDGDGNKKDENKDPKDPSEEEKEEQKKGDGEEKKETPEQPQRKSQLSPQQIQNLLEAMQNAEKKSQEKLDAKKAKGSPVKTKKDW